MRAINIIAENLEDPFEFQGPTINISKYDNITLQSVYLELSSSLRPCLIDVTTTITDKNVGNPERSIVSYYQPSQKRTIFFTPTSTIPYKIQGSWLNESYFKIVFGREVDSLKINKVRLVVTLDGSQSHT